MILSGTTDILELTRSSTADIDVLVEWADMDDSTKAVTVGEQESTFNTAATGTILAAPSSGFSRKAKWISMVNRHASTANTLTLQKDVSGTNYVVDSFTLAAGERASWTTDRGMRVFDAEGREKTSALPAAGTYTVTRLATTVTNATTTAAKITGLDTPCSAGTFVFEYFLRAQSATATVGFKLGCSYSGTASIFPYMVYFPTQAATDSSGVHDQILTAPSVMGVMADRVESTTAPLISTAGVDTTGADLLICITGLMVCSTTGNLELYHASETATNTSIMSDSVLRITKFA